MAIHPDYAFYNFRGEPDLEANHYTVSIELYDGWGNFIGEVADYQDAKFMFSADVNDVEASSFSVSGSSPWAKALMRAHAGLLLVHFVLRRDEKIVKVWTGRVEQSSWKMEGPQGTITVSLVSEKIWLKYILGQNSPFTELWIQQKRDIQFGQAVTVMKKYLARNLTRIAYQRAGKIIGNPQAALQAGFNERPEEWPTLQDWMYPVTLVPSLKAEDKSPQIALMSRMTSMADLFKQVATDNNIYIQAHCHIPGRDVAPKNLPMRRPGVWIDVIDKDKARSRGEKEDTFKGLASAISVFIRGLFGRFDEPRTFTSHRMEDLLDWFGREETDPWVIFRNSPEHFSHIEVNSYAPTVSRSVTGGKSPEVVNRGIEFLINTGIKLLASQIGLLLPNILSGQLDDILLAYRDAQDWKMRDELGPFTLYEEYASSAVNAYGVDAAQALRSSRREAMGFRTAVFTADASSFPPFLPFEDFDILDQVGFEDPAEDVIQMERVKVIQVTSDSTGVTFEMTLGEADRPEDPIAVQQRRMEMIISAINTLASND